MRVAVIDLGTNTFNLSVADVDAGHFRVLCSDKEGVGLGMGGINEGMIAADAIERGLKALEKFKKIGIDQGAEHFVLIGTSALRNAANREDFLSLVAKKLGLKIQVISGRNEAELIYAGVATGLQFTEPSMIMDIGGGSTEFILAGPGGPIRYRSFEMGVSRIFQLFRLSDPFTEENIRQIETYLENSCGDFFGGMDVKILIGASGTFETFYELCFNELYPAKKLMTTSTKDMKPHLEYLIRSTLAQRDKNEWIVPIRKKMAPVAAVKTRWIIRKLQVEKLIISPFSLKEGVMKNIAKYVDTAP